MVVGANAIASGGDGCAMMVENSHLNYYKTNILKVTVGNDHDRLPVRRRMTVLGAP